MRPYDPPDWYWIVGGDESRVWSSAVSAYVSEWPADAVTRIANEESLTEVLRAYRLRGPIVTVADYQAAIVAMLDAAAQARRYDNGLSLSTYTGSTNPAWAAEAQAFVAWRDAVWDYVYAELDKVLAGQRVQPSIEAFLAELPALTWPV